MKSGKINRGKDKKRGPKMVYKYIQKVKHLQRGSPLQKETQQSIYKNNHHPDGKEKHFIFTVINTIKIKIRIRSRNIFHGTVTGI